MKSFKEFISEDDKAGKELRTYEIRAQHHSNQAHRRPGNTSAFAMHAALSQYFQNKADNYPNKTHAKNKAEFQKNVENNYPKHVK